MMKAEAKASDERGTCSVTAIGARYDYTKGKLAELIEVIIEEKTALFVCAIGVPPKHAVDRLHQAGIPVRPFSYCNICERLMMMFCPDHEHGRAPEARPEGTGSGRGHHPAQAGEGGGHTGDISASIPIPACVDAVKGHMSPLNGKPVYVVGAGAVCDGRGLAANLMWGAEAVSVEASAPPKHKKFIVSAGFEDAFTTLIFTGRALRVRRTDYIDNWNNNRQAEIKELTSKGILPHEAELEKHPSLETRSWLMGRVSSVIVDNMVTDAAAMLQRGSLYLKAKLQRASSARRSFKRAQSETLCFQRAMGGGKTWLAPPIGRPGEHLMC
ncbi:hypothetical protein FB451DRAFT_1379215 [Mycena latifolia]|nr:hypothetical protein FB451DRAFT_1379215 [Mycena latifolia]